MLSMEAANGGYWASTTRQNEKRTLAVLYQFPQAVDIPLHKSRDCKGKKWGSAAPARPGEPSRLRH
jgi:hypothetical protein